MNINDVNLCPIHVAYETVCRVARELGVEVTGTELIGLIPENCLVEAGRYFAAKQGVQGVDSDGLIELAVEAMHLEDLCPFDTERKILR
jgi:glutamate formiminotransferase/formiminotetrahydrofolate cyclodeaminase